LVKRRIEGVFGKEKEKQEGLGRWFGWLYWNLLNLNFLIIQFMRLTNDEHCLVGKTIDRGINKSSLTEVLGVTRRTIYRVSSLFRECYLIFSILFFTLFLLKKKN
jgi:hypothetical protein